MSSPGPEPLLGGGDRELRMLSHDAEALEYAAAIIKRRAKPRDFLGRFLLGVLVRLLRETADDLRKKAGDG